MQRFTRRSALRSLAALSSSWVVPSPVLAASQSHEVVKLGVIADLHGGLAIDAAERLDAFLTAMKEASCDALVQLGDFAFPNAKHQAFADAFRAAHEHTLHVIGNHEFDHGLTREDCYKAWGIEASYYGTDLGGLRILVLDGNDRDSPTHGGGYHSYIGPQQQAWLAHELEASTRPLLILSHQPLAGQWAIDNAKDIQQLLGKHRSKVLLCLNGHSHLDAYVQVEGVPYLHINSASYFWVGGDVRMAYYSQPLFTTVTIDPQTATIRVDSCESGWKEQSPEAIGYFQRENRPSKATVVPRIRRHHLSRTALNVMTWNIWGRLNEDPRYTIDGKTSRDRTIDILRASGADVIAMIETYGSAATIAEALNYPYHTAAADANLCLFSRYPLVDVERLEGLNPFSFLAATVMMPGGQAVRVYDIWLTSDGRHIVEIKDSSVSDEAFARGDDIRDAHLRELLHHSTFKRDLAASDTVPLIVAGDFNCVSHLDYSEATAKAGHNHGRSHLGIGVSQAMAQAGFIDAYRAVHPNITADTLGHTWTTVGTDYLYQSGKGFLPTDNHPRPEYRDLYTRIDYIYARGPLKAVDARVRAHHPQAPDRQFPHFPSDHAAVEARFVLEE